MQSEGSRIRAWAGGQVRSAQLRRAADRGQEVAGGSEVKHLLDRNPAQGRPPARDARYLVDRQALLSIPFHREQREQVGAQHVVLQLGRLREQVDELSAVLDANCGHSCPPFEQAVSRSLILLR